MPLELDSSDIFYRNSDQWMLRCSIHEPEENGSRDHAGNKFHATANGRGARISLYSMLNLTKRPEWCLKGFMKKQHVLAVRY